jgi:hypothetical protein
MMRAGKFLLSIAGAMMALAVARADIIETFSHTTPTSAVPFTDVFLLPGFDTSLGVLDTITLTLETSGTAEVDVLNLTGSPQAFTGAKAVIPVTLTGPGGVSTAASLSAGPESGVAAPGSNAFPGLPASASNSVGVLPADFSLYEGSGPIVSVTIDAGSGTYSGSAVPGVFFGGSTTADAITTIDYAYSPSTTIPEPATMSLFVGTLLGISFVLKKYPQR